MTHEQRMAALVEAGEKLTSGPLVAEYDTDERVWLLMDAEGGIIAEVYACHGFQGLGNEQGVARSNALALLAAANARDTIALAAEIVKAAGEYAVVTSTQGPTSIADAAMAELDALLAEWNRERNEQRTNEAP